MNPNNPYFKQVQLLVRVLPMLADHPVFALKGGTAINLFVHDLPRLSVDIDLAYEPIKNRADSLADIHFNLTQIAQKLEKQGLQVQRNNPSEITRLTVSSRQAQIKIETSPVLRGTVHSTQMMQVSSKVEEVFGFAEMQVLSFEDLYAGKLCAALDRQHPRDLYDVHTLLNQEGINEKLKDTFLVYLISHPRPMHELLNPNFKDITAIYQAEFANMTQETISVEALLSARQNMVRQLQAQLNEQDKSFLLSVKSAKPDWSLFAYPNAADLPAVKWKLHNLSNMDNKARQQAFAKLENLLTHFL